MHLLRRAAETHNNPQSICIQDVETTRSEYDRLRTDDLTKYIDWNFERLPGGDPNTGVDLTWF